MVKKNALKNLIYPFIGIVLFIVIWALAAKAINFDLILPTPAETFKALGGLLKTKKFYSAVFSTVLRSLKGFCISFLVAIVLAVICSFFNKLNSILSPIITILRATPTMSIILLTLIWMKSNTAPVFIAALIVFPIMYSNFYHGLVSVDKDIIEMSKVYKVKKLDIISKFYIPAISPAMLDTIKSSVSLNLKVVIASEVLAQTSNSIGVMMQTTRLYLDTPMLMAWTIAAIVMGYLLEISVIAIKSMAIKW